jgi:hypothetical protein
VPVVPVKTDMAVEMIRSAGKAFAGLGLYLNNLYAGVLIYGNINIRPAREITL